jgi:hypothetical protein
VPADLTGEGRPYCGLSCQNVAIIMNLVAASSSIRSRSCTLPASSAPGSRPAPVELPPRSRQPAAALPWFIVANPRTTCPH